MTLKATKSSWVKNATKMRAHTLHQLTEDVLSLYNPSKDESEMLSWVTKFLLSSGIVQENEIQSDISWGLTFAKEYHIAGGAVEGTTPTPLSTFVHRYGRFINSAKGRTIRSSLGQ